MTKCFIKKDVIKKLRNELGLTNRQLCEKSGIPYGTLEQWLYTNNKKTVRPGNAKMLADALGCAFEDISEMREA